LFQPGLIHSKTATVDEAFGLFGSANLDVRSFVLNFELSVLLYGKEITERLRDIQRGYLKQSRRLDISAWQTRPVINEYADRAVSLLSPLL
jgi:cardiolipin synthase